MPKIGNGFIFISFHSPHSIAMTISAPMERPSSLSGRLSMAMKKSGSSKKPQLQELYAKLSESKRWLEDHLKLQHQHSGEHPPQDLNVVGDNTATEHAEFDLEKATADIHALPLIETGSFDFDGLTLPPMDCADLGISWLNLVADETLTDLPPPPPPPILGHRASPAIVSPADTSLTTATPADTPPATSPAPTTTAIALSRGSSLRTKPEILATTEYYSRLTPRDLEYYFKFKPTGDAKGPDSVEEYHRYICRQIPRLVIQASTNFEQMELMSLNEVHNTMKVRE